MITDKMVINALHEYVSGDHDTPEQAMRAALTAALAKAWRPINEAPHGVRVLLGWRDWRDGAWCMEVGCASHGRRTEAGSREGK